MQNNIAATADPIISQSSLSAGSGSLDLSALRLPQDFSTGVSVKKVITSIPMRKPGNQTFFRVHPDADRRFQAAMLQLKDDGECFLVSRPIVPDVAQEIRAKQLYYALTRDGIPFLWPVNLPGEDGRLDSWSQSAHAAAQIAESSWVRLVANRGFGAYDVMQATGNLDEPNWPDLDFEAVLQLAFKDRVINSADHPVIRRLRGEL
ncbi:MAG: hypothetical protein H6935_11145 [Thiobacillus sp.]|nr:hypothetical protein [Thiobacillus sp.]